MADTNSDNRINDLSNSLSQREINVKDFGAVGDGTTDDRQAITKAITTSNTLGVRKIIFPKGTYYYSGTLNMPTPVKLKGEGDAVLLSKNPTSSQDIPISSDDITLEGLHISSASNVQAVATVANGVNHLSIIDSSIESVGHGVHLNHAETTDVHIRNSEIHAQNGYGYLLNYNSTQSRNFSLINNKISSDQTDAIEINTPNNSDIVASGIRIIGNEIIAGNASTATTGGFAIGIAQGKDISIIGNTIKESRRDALHIEDASENVTVVGNVFAGCRGDGCVVFNRSKSATLYAKTPIITGNHFKKLDNTKKGYGLWRVYDGNGVLNFNFGNNRIEGFDKGMFVDGRGCIHADGTFIENCNIGIIASASHVFGTVYLSKTPTLIHFQKDTFIDRVVSYTKVDPATMFTHSLAKTQLATLKSAYYLLNDYKTIVGVNKIPIIKAPAYGEGSIKISMLKYGGAEKIDLYFRYEVSSGSIQSNLKLVNQAGAIFSNYSLILEDGFIKLSMKSSSTVTLNPITIDLDGTYMLNETVLK
ncbi:MAG: glycosyl hydrolase family 28-related protein [Bacillus sp. (in: firmicutes)]